jgi:hypothetical protein
VGVASRVRSSTPDAVLELADEELHGPLRKLAAPTVEHVAEAVAAPPAEWGLPMADRVALARYLWDRAGTIVARPFRDVMARRAWIERLRWERKRPRPTSSNRGRPPRL